MIPRGVTQAEVDAYRVYSMSIEQLSLFPEMPERKKPSNKEKRNWEDAFQRWSNRQCQDGTNSYGVCGYGSMCDWCENMEIGRPCVRALNAMCRDKGIKLDYSNRSFEEVWNR